jgi:hypothetical protein
MIQLRGKFCLRSAMKRIEYNGFHKYSPFYKQAHCAPLFSELFPLGWGINFPNYIALIKARIDLA